MKIGIQISHPCMATLMSEFKRIRYVCVKKKGKKQQLNLTLGPVYMEKSYPGQEGHPSSRVNFTERLYEKRVVPFARVKSWLSNNSRAGACSDPLAFTELTRVGEPKCLYARCKLLTTVKIF